MGATSAIFVDAGYFFAQGSYAVAGNTKRRTELDFDAEQFMDELAQYVARYVPKDTSLLRIYWYDGARNGNCTPEQLRIGALMSVKLRVGRINGQGQQKGVDTLIVRDLMVLSQERSINYAIVLSGDEDLREGIEYAQDRGVIVYVVGIRGSGGMSQSGELVREADQALELDSSCLKNLSVLPPAENQGEVLPLKVPTDVETVAETALAFVSEWKSQVDADVIESAEADRPSVPRALDASLLQAVAKRLGRSIRHDEPMRREARGQFWKAFDQA